MTQALGIIMEEGIFLPPWLYHQLDSNLQMKLAYLRYASTTNVHCKPSAVSIP